MICSKSQEITRRIHRQSSLDLLTNIKEKNPQRKLINQLITPPVPFQLPVPQSAGAWRGPGDCAGLSARQIHNWSGRGGWGKCFGTIRSGTSGQMPGPHPHQLHGLGRISIGHFQNEGESNVLWKGKGFNLRSRTLNFEKKGFSCHLLLLIIIKIPTTHQCGDMTHCQLCL